MSLFPRTDLGSGRAIDHKSHPSCEKTDGKILRKEEGFVDGVH